MDSKFFLLVAVLFLCLPFALSQGIIAEYSVEINPNGGELNEVQVKAVFYNAGESLSVSAPSGEFNGKITVKNAFDSQNNAVSVQKLSDSSWSISSTSPKITVEYSAITASKAPMTQGAFLAYVTEECGLIYAGSILLMPQAQGSARVNFSIPEGWSIIADETWIPLGNNSFEVRTQDLPALVGVGKFSKFEGTFGDSQKLELGICGKTRHEKNSYLPGLKSAFDYLHRTVGKLPQKELHIVIAEIPQLPVDYMSATPRLAVNRSDRDWGMLEGMIWHYWFLRYASYASQLEGDKIWWFGESLSPFYLNPIYEKLNAVEEITQASQFTIPGLSWKNWYAGIEDKLGTKYDIPLTDYITKGRETNDSGYYFPMMYFKGSMVLEMLNQSIMSLTQGKKSIQEIGKLIFEDFAVQGKGYSNNDVLNAANSISGADFGEFFDSFVFGSERLPVIKENGDYYFDWSIIAEKVLKSSPNSEKTMPSPSISKSSLEMKKETPHFTAFFHEKDSKQAALLLLDCEKSYKYVAEEYGGEANKKIKMFITYDSKEYAEFGGNAGNVLGEDYSAGGVGVEDGSEINWLRPIKSTDSVSSHLSAVLCSHELSHAMMRQVYPGVYKNFERWFNESNFIQKIIWLDYNSDPINPYLDHSQYLQLTTSLNTGSPKVIELSQLLSKDFSSISQEEQFLNQAEGESFWFFINSRYPNGIQALLKDFNKGVTFKEAVKNAFGSDFNSVEEDFWKVSGKAAQNSSKANDAIRGLKSKGIDTGFAEKLSPNEPFLALLSGYSLAEQNGLNIESIPLIEEQKPKEPEPGQQPQENQDYKKPLPQQNDQNQAGEQPGDFPWPLLIVIPVILLIIYGIMKLVKAFFKAVFRKK